MYIYILYFVSVNPTRQTQLCGSNVQILNRPAEKSQSRASTSRVTFLHQHSEVVSQFDAHAHPHGSETTANQSPTPSTSQQEGGYLLAGNNTEITCTQRNKPGKII